MLASRKRPSGRAAGVFSRVPCCAIFWENADGANGRTSAVQVGLRQGDQLPASAATPACCA